MMKPSFSIGALILLTIALLMPAPAQAQRGDVKALELNPSPIPCSTVKSREIVSGKLVNKYDMTSVNTTGGPLQSGTLIIWKLSGDHRYADGQQFSVLLNSTILAGAKFTVSAWTLADEADLPALTQSLTCTAVLAKFQSLNP